MTENYLTIFMNTAFSVGNVLAPLSLFFLFLARILPIIALSPFFGARVLPHPVKVTFAISLFVIFLPQLLVTTQKTIYFDTYLVVLMVKELFVGLILGFMISIPFAIVQNAGIIIDHQRGGASLMVNDPTIQNQSSPLGTLFNYILIFIFFAIDGPFLFLNGLVTSYEVIPPDQLINTYFFDQGAPFWDMLVKLFNVVMVLSVQLSAPALVAILMTNVFLGIANRLAPQVQITFLGMPLTSLLALIVIALGWSLFSEELILQCYKWLDTIKNVLSMMATRQET
jgi:type III secretion protein SpaR/YscT/HrcT